MALYKIDKKLEHIKDVPFRFEKDIQKLTEENLNTLLGLDFIKTEFALSNLRIDTLAFNNETNSFVIIEFKNKENFSVIDQGYAYLALMLNNKADFILEYNECKNKTLKRNDVDWSQSKVIFISPRFSTYQREAINFKDLPIELWEIKKFENNTLSFEQIQKTTAKESIKTISKSDEIVEKVNKEVVVYTEQGHINNANDEIQELYYELKNRLQNLDSEIEIQPQKYYVAFKMNKSNICDIKFQKKCLKIGINLKIGQLEDVLNKARDVSNIGHSLNGDYQIKIDNFDDIDYVVGLLKQSLKKNKQ
jgi:predicted transport protein